MDLAPRASSATRSAMEEVSVDMVTDTVVATTRIVNNRDRAVNDRACCARYDDHMDTLLSRLEWVLSTRDTSARQLSIQAGLSHATIASLIRGLKADPSTAARVEVGTLDKIAAAAGVDPTWLKSGIGAPEFNQAPPRAADPDPATNATSSAASFRNLANWNALLRSARSLRPTLPEWVWTRVAASSPMLTSPPTPLMLAEYADLISRHEIPPA